MSFDDNDCFFREEQIWNSIFDNIKKTIRVETRNKKTPTIKRIQVSNKDTEESFTIPKGTVAFTIKDRGNSRMRYSYNTGEVENSATGEYLDRGPYGIYKEDDLNLFEDIDLYFASSKDSRIIELIYWI